MQLCLECGKVEEHADECPRRPPVPTTPAEKQKRVQKAMTVAQAVLDASATAAPKVAILKLLAAENLLERYPSRDLPGFAEKRSHNDLVTALGKKRGELETSSGAGHKFTEDAVFAKQAVSALFLQALRRAESRGFDRSALGRLPVSPVEGLTRPLKNVAADIGDRLEKSRGLDAQVRVWGWKNLGRLMLGLEPLDVPSELMGGVLGKLGVGKSTRRIELLGEFKKLGDQFRERLYLIAASSTILPVMSRLAVAEETWKKLTTKDGGAERWDRIKKDEKELLEYILDPDPSLPQGAEDVVSLLASNSRALVVLGLRPFEEIRGVDWEAWAKGYFLELHQMADGDMASGEFGTRKLARLLVEKRPGEGVDRDKIARVLQKLQEVWRSSPPDA
ncbi:MAG TPA: hypothetical protein VFF73_24330 [Planctomycetota bacterium]|nr:hypothetical protein [Planctomycetota bacterium]